MDCFKTFNVLKQSTFLKICQDVTHFGNQEVELLPPWKNACETERLSQIPRSYDAYHLLINCKDFSLRNI